MISSGVDEGFSGKAKPTARKAYGLRTPQGIEIGMFSKASHAESRPGGTVAVAAPAAPAIRKIKKHRRPL